ncbi:ABC transporter substrate-binding protein [Corynebacterium phocae]|uniref:ABC transporter substrate-binding protein n=1 Tax=Corynebacterium phocae TaxID=161895 RepID=A0A1L7D592_9CORY|nr:ABC transporter substrate-binding protein [Corynebacterium phocae]APT93336.1 ABC transporter substrate-binding protein [Corynebacterium phocae]KAA8721668.1 ABC transporter substrate-binding protein [Corynebacterium phocae]
MKRLTPVLCLAFALTACGGQDPLDAPDADTSAAAPGASIVIGTANFPESEILGQLWAAVLEDEGFDVTVKSGIGSREVYLEALESGEINVMPEYTGSLAQYYGAELEPGADADAVYASLESVLPEKLKVGKMSAAESKDSFNVTEEFSKANGVTSIADLAKLDGFTLGANPEIVNRPFGPKGLKEVYGIDNVEVKPISDAGGPLTVAALAKGEIDVANIYTTSPVLDRDGNELPTVRLEDPKNIISAQNVVPLYAQGVPAEAIASLDAFNAGLLTENLKAMNVRHVGPEKAEVDVIVEEFFTD